MNRHSVRPLTAKIYAALGMLTGSQATGILCSIVRVKLVALWIGTAGVGLFGIFNSALEMMAALTQLSLRSSAVRDIAVAPQSGLPRIVAVVRRWGLWLGLAGVVAMLAASPLLSLMSFGSVASWPLYTLLAAAMFTSSVAGAEQAVMQGTGALKRLASTSMWSAVVALALAVPLLWLGRAGAIVPVLVLYSVVLAVVSRVRRVAIAPAVPAPDARQTLTEGRQFLKLGTFMTVSGFLSWGTTYGLLSWLNREAGEATVGYFQTGSTVLLRYVGVFFTAIAMEFYPRVARVADNRRRTSLFVNHEIITVLRIGAPLLCLLVLTAPLLIRLLYTPAFLPAVPFVALAAIGMAPRVVAWCISYVLISRSDGRVYILTEVLSVVYYVVLVVVGYRLAGVAGFGWGFAGWYVLDMLTMTVVGAARSGIVLRRATWLWVLATVAAVAFCAWLMPHLWPGL